MIAIWSMLIFLLFKCAHLFGRFSPTLKRYLEVQKECAPKIADIRKKRGSAKEAFLFFVSSAGEYEQVKPVISRMQQLYSESYVYIIFFSPSGIRFARSRKETLDYALCPPDVSSLWAQFFDALSPSAVFVNRYELWPAFLDTASKRSKLYLINANKPNKDSTWGAIFKRIVIGYFDKIFIVSREGEAFFQNQLKASSDKIKIVGDTKFDRVFERAAQVAKAPKESVQVVSSLWSRKEGSRCCLVLGSVWPKDIEVFWHGFEKLTKAQQKQFCLIAAPHEPSQEHLAQIETEAARLGLVHVRLSDLLSGKRASVEPDVVVGDTIGHLFDLYSLGQFAFVGGGMHYQVHNVLEPVSYGLGVAFGPHHKNSAEAGMLIQNGLATEILQAKDVTGWLSKALEDSRSKGVQERKAFVESWSGASDRICRDVWEHLRK